MDTQDRSRLSRKMNICNWCTEDFLFMHYNQKDFLIKCSTTEDLMPRPFKKGDTLGTYFFCIVTKTLFGFAGE